jgi:peptidyl-prolyl cis-trans isomerase NIMA-interacting 1
MVHSTGLPPEWEVRVSKTRQMPYYFNRETNESRWEPPPNTDTATLSNYLTTTFSSSQPPSSQEKIRVRHLLIKHSQSRRPSSWKEVSPHPPILLKTHWH